MPLLGLGVFIVYKRSKRKKRKYHAPPANQLGSWWDRVFNVTHGLALKVLKPFNYDANLFLKLIIF